jgi:hypothetical protein
LHAGDLDPDNPLVKSQRVNIMIRVHQARMSASNTL